MTAKRAQHTIPTIYNIPFELKFYTILWYGNHSNSLISRTSHFLERFTHFAWKQASTAWQLLPLCCDNVGYKWSYQQVIGSNSVALWKCRWQVSFESDCVVGREILYLSESRMQLESSHTCWTLISFRAIRLMGNTLNATRRLIHRHSGRFVVDSWYP